MSYLVAIEHSQSKMTATEALDAVLAKIQRYDASVEGGCDCCGTWIEYDQYDRGDLVKYDELEHLINTLKAELAK